MGREGKQYNCLLLLSCKITFPKVFSNRPGIVLFWYDNNNAKIEIEHCLILIDLLGADLWIVDIRHEVK